MITDSKTYGVGYIAQGLCWHILAVDHAIYLFHQREDPTEIESYVLLYPDGSLFEMGMAEQKINGLEQAYDLGHAVLIGALGRAQRREEGKADDRD